MSNVYEALLVNWDPEQWAKRPDGFYQRFVTCADCGGRGCQWCGAEGMVKLRVNPVLLREKYGHAEA